MDIKEIFHFKNIMNRRKKEPIKIVFAQPSEDSKLDATLIISRLNIPRTPQLEILEKAYSTGDELIEKLSIKLAEDNKSWNKKGVVGEGGKIYEEIIRQRNTIKSVIEKMVQPTINVTGDNSLQINRLWTILFELDKRIQNLEGSIKNIYGVAPPLSINPNGKILWYDTMKRAAEEIIDAFKRDEKNTVRLYRSLRDASDDYYEHHSFVRNPDLTKDMLYDNVKKANSFWGKEGNLRE